MKYFNLHRLEILNDLGIDVTKMLRNMLRAEYMRRCLEIYDLLYVKNETDAYQKLQDMIRDYRNADITVREIEMKLDLLHNYAIITDIGNAVRYAQEMFLDKAKMFRLICLMIMYLAAFKIEYLDAVYHFKDTRDIVDRFYHRRNRITMMINDMAYELSEKDLFSVMKQFNAMNSYYNRLYD